jgi:adenylate kinase
MNLNIKKPQMVILYGPPGSGKGTQAKLLQEKFGYEFLDFGQSFRNFAKENIQEDNPNYLRAKRVNEAFESGLPILTEDFFYIVQEKIENYIKEKKSFIIDKPGSLIEEAKWFNQVIKKFNISNIFIHLNLAKDISLQRISNRWYLPSNPIPYTSYQNALENAIFNEKPYRRVEDESQDVSSKRIDNLYGQHDVILAEYEQNGIKINNINANDEIINIHTEILKLF